MVLVYFGSGAFGLPTLERLAAAHRIALVVTQPDRPAGRHRHLRPTPVGELSLPHGLETIKPDDIDDPQVRDRVHAAGADAFVVCDYGEKLGPDLLEGVFAINLHGSLLPRYRGAAPVSWAIINGEAETGVTVITITQRIDAGAILARRATPIDPMETAGELEGRLAEMGPDLVLETLARHEAGKLEPVTQDDRLACRAPKLSKADGTVRFDQAARAVQRRVHGLTPRPGCTVTIEGRRLRVARVEVVDEARPHGAPGEVLRDRTVACGTGAVRWLEVQPPGGKLMPFAAYLHGHPLRVSSRFEPL
ncbi:MAG: methionyl-tRNA formyltransferase [Planctomycetota bacterium]|jgi:methionyl-tRNA formyltransferase